ncbi:hypothetical protein P691DRAFT_789710 [Macrolepiota fuliginosa MF-IS2]|uniref:Uncharacterized protein n=1 Tax=Macrolepiota fuliginosa MF-IS2 TaxID=1400762 RepID=A0A9P5XJB3_9AGAR|nr:hypothetical protein P691DRAFT_789710 [Macrolepiota fuliginosa MF-IS2]
MSTNNKFTVPEFIELLICSVLGGLLAGGLMVYLYIQSKKYGCMGRTQVQKEADGEWVLDITPRQRVSIPIQDPPNEERFSALTRNLSFSVRAATGTSHDDRRRDSIIHDDIRSWAPVPTTPDSQNHQYFLPNGSSRHSRSAHSTPPSTPREMRMRGIVGNSGSNLELLSRTTTTVSTLPPYDTLSLGPPRYPTSGTSFSDVLTGPETTDPVDPLPQLPRQQQGPYENFRIAIARRTLLGSISASTTLLWNLMALKVRNLRPIIPQRILYRLLRLQGDDSLAKFSKDRTNDILVPMID